VFAFLAIKETFHQGRKKKSISVRHPAVSISRRVTIGR